MTRNEKLREILQKKEELEVEVSIIGNDFQVKGIIEHVFSTIDKVKIFSHSLGFIDIDFNTITSII